MGLVRFVTKHGIGSPGSIAKAMAKTYAIIKRRNRGIPEREVLRQIYLSRVQAGSMIGVRAVRSGLLNADPAHVEDVLAHAPDLASLVIHVIFMEHPELLDHRGAPPDQDESLKRVVLEVLDKQAPGSRRV